MAVIDNLNIIKSCKEDIKQAIINKGVDMTGVSLEGYATKDYVQQEIDDIEHNIEWGVL